MKLYLKFLLPFLICSAAELCFAQDIHFSQFYNTPLNLNPALTSIFKGDIRVVANYREQWQSVPVPYLTFSGAYDQKIFAKFLGDGFIGAGLIFNYDKAGDADLSWTQVGLNFSYTKPITQQLFITGGFQYLIGSRSFQPNQLTFAEQWNGDIFDPNLSNTEAFTSTSKGLNSLSAGLNFHFQVDKTRTKLDGGFGLYHINEPATSFMNDATVQLARKGNGYLTGTIQFHPNMDARFFGFYSSQGEFAETVAGAAIRYHISLQKSREISLQIGSGYRFGDALIPSFEVQYYSIRVGLSYDLNVSGFDIATNGRGGPEVSFEYIFTKVKPVKARKACPIF